MKSYWKPLTSVEQLDAILCDEKNTHVIFKHSTRCSISAAALNRVERNFEPNYQQITTFYYLDLLAYRIVSNAIAEKLGVVHQSPQLIVCRGKNVLYHASHFDIDLQAAMRAAGK